MSISIALNVFLQRDIQQWLKDAMYLIDRFVEISLGSDRTCSFGLRLLRCSVCALTANDICRITAIRTVVSNASRVLKAVSETLKCT